MFCLGNLSSLKLFGLFGPFGAFDKLTCLLPTRLCLRAEGVGDDHSTRTSPIAFVLQRAQGAMNLKNLTLPVGCFDSSGAASSKVQGVNKGILHLEKIHLASMMDKQKPPINWCRMFVTRRCARPYHPKEPLVATQGARSVELKSPIRNHEFWGSLGKPCP